MLRLLFIGGSGTGKEVTRLSHQTEYFIPRQRTVSLCFPAGWREELGSSWGNRTTEKTHPFSKLSSAWVHLMSLLPTLNVTGSC